MTKEITDILTAFNIAHKESRRTALATVVHVEGSSYRRPGARMLVEDNGKITGAISGGCLEGDALRKALLAINQQKNKLVTYNTLHPDDIEFGVQLGCNGVVHILFEPIDPYRPNNPISLLETCYIQRKESVLVTLFSIKNFHGHQPGTCLFFNGQYETGNIPVRVFEEEIKETLTEVFNNRQSILRQCGNSHLAAFVEWIQPPISLHIVGAGNDALPLVDMATVLGWEITVIDGRRTHAKRQRFAKAKDIIVGAPEAAFNQLDISEQSAFLLMTHNYNYDLEMLPLLLQSPCAYIGILGPKSRLERLLADLAEGEFFITVEQMAKIFGPTGLDIGADASEEIALSMLAEIKAVMSGRCGGFLKDRLDGIHTRPTAIPEKMKPLLNMQNK